MRNYRKWLLSLGLVASVPSAGAWAAGPFDAYPSARPTAPVMRSQTPTTQQAKALNQKVAKDIATVLGRAQLTTEGVKIRFLNGTATISGKILDARQKAVVSQLVSRVPNVQQVDNQLVPMRGATPSRPTGIRQTGFQDSAVRPASTDAVNPNVAVAKKIASQLKSAGLSSYDIQIAYQDGMARLSGSVPTSVQWETVQRVTQSVPEVQQVDNRLSVLKPSAPTQRPGMPISRAAYQPPVAPMAGPGGMTPPPAYAQPGPGANMSVYNQPNLPSHAWPSYAAYPNSAAVSYPTQYSASAWPYIGPFYPYPQVPLGWRKAELEWDDGFWALKFHSKTDRWWWFMNPKNW